MDLGWPRWPCSCSPHEQDGCCVLHHSNLCCPYHGCSPSKAQCSISNGKGHSEGQSTALCCCEPPQHSCVNASQHLSSFRHLQGAQRAARTLRGEGKDHVAAICVSPEAAQRLQLERLQGEQSRDSERSWASMCQAAVNYAT